MNSLFNKVSSSIKIIDNVHVYPNKKEIIFLYNVRKKVPDNKHFHGNMRHLVHGAKTHPRAERLKVFMHSNSDFAHLQL